MTRINCVPVQELCNKHLFAEWRELPRIKSYVSKSINKGLNVLDIPPHYVLGKGHVKFFYNKLSFLIKRYDELTKELLDRGYNIEKSELIMEGLPNWFNDWVPTQEDIMLNRHRIKERMPKNPKWSKI